MGGGGGRPGRDGGGAERHLLRVGLTGNIAAGKSTVARWLRQLGCHLIDADELARRCLAPGEPAYDEVVAAFGGAILAADGSVDRGALARCVFTDPHQRRLLEGILHPRILAREELEVARWASRRKAGVIVTEAALLYEAGASRRYHRIVVVTAPEPVRLGRLVAAGLSRREARERIAAQMDQERKAELADYVIDNGGELGAARRQVERLWAQLREDLEHRLAGKPLPARPRPRR